MSKFFIRTAHRRHRHRHPHRDRGHGVDADAADLAVSQHRSAGDSGRRPLYPGADAKTLTEAVATPIEQQMNGVDNMLYMYSVNANNGQATVYVDFDVKTNPDTDQVLSQLRVSQAQSQLPRRSTPPA